MKNKIILKLVVSASLFVGGVQCLYSMDNMDPSKEKSQQRMIVPVGQASNETEINADESQKIMRGEMSSREEKHRGNLQKFAHIQDPEARSEAEYAEGIHLIDSHHESEGYDFIYQAMQTGGQKALYRYFGMWKFLVDSGFDGIEYKRH